MKVYISGAISGLDPEVCKNKFEASVNYLSSIFADVLNPYKGWKPGYKYVDYMADAISDLSQCTHIYMQSDWKQSKGARIEHTIAKESGIVIMYE